MQVPENGKHHAPRKVVGSRRQVQYSIFNLNIQFVLKSSRVTGASVCNTALQIYILVQHLFGARWCCRYCFRASLYTTWYAGVYSYVQGGLRKRHAYGGGGGGACPRRILVVQGIAQGTGYVALLASCCAELEHSTFS